MNVKELAEQAGIEYSNQWAYWTAYEQDLERFAELVRQDEREANAKLAENGLIGHTIAKAIRARSKHDTNK